MIRMTKVPTAPTPSTTKPFLSHTYQSSYPNMLTNLMNQIVILQKKQTYLTRMILILPHLFICEISFQFPWNQKMLTRVHFKFPMDTKKLIIEDHKEVKVISSTHHSTIGNHLPAPKPKPVHSSDICPSPEKPSQDEDKSHLSDSTSTTHSLNETGSLDTSGDHLLHLDSPSLSSEL